MNARFLERFVRYREKHALPFCKTIIIQKIKCQFVIVNQRERYTKYEKYILSTSNIEAILLLEGRAAREYWRIFGQKIIEKGKIDWVGRKAHSDDAVNKLLDIGYHYLIQRLIGIFNKLEIPTELGLFHKAQGKRSAPFVYDFVEWLRPFVVDEILLKMIHKKKNRIELIDKKIISYFLFNVKKKFDQKYFHRNLNYCVTLNYWVKLILLEFVGCVNGNKIYKPIFPTLRHETRCKTFKKTA